MSPSASKQRDAHIHFLVDVIQRMCNMDATLQYMRDTGWRADARGTFWVLHVPGVGHVQQVTGKWPAAPTELEFLQRRLATLAGCVLRGTPLNETVLRLCGWRVFPGDGSNLIRPQGHGLSNQWAQSCPICTAPAGAPCQDENGVAIAGIHLARFDGGEG